MPTRNPGISTQKIPHKKAKVRKPLGQASSPKSPKSPKAKSKNSKLQVKKVDVKPKVEKKKVDPTDFQKKIASERVDMFASENLRKSIDKKNREYEEVISRNSSPHSIKKSHRIVSP